MNFRLSSLVTKRPLKLCIVFLIWSVGQSFGNKAQSEEYWAFQPLKKTSPPKTNSHWLKNPIDQFVLRKLQQKNLSFSEEADRSTLIRRTYFNLLGFPPKAEDAQKFAEEISQQAYEKLIDQLLQNQHFGERWARHWLDVARFGESEGSNPEEDRIRGHAYKYRDAVIHAFNQDLPFDEFVAMQVSGKGLKIDSPFAKDLYQFTQLGTRIQRNSHPNEKKFHILDDMVSATGSAFLALTVGCARCHDHKLDPISTEEYYQLTAVYFDLAKVNPKVGVNTIDVIKEPQVLAGGSWQRPVKKISSGFLKALMRNQRSSDAWLIKNEAGSSSNQKNLRPPREALARWLTDVDHGSGALLARVIVNRLWQHYFGRGLVETPNDFGKLGEPPSHPDLLDWLARELIRNDWKLKPIHKLILTSATYRQSSSGRYATQDRENRWLWHYRTRRLEAEAIRDSLLKVSGSLKTKMYGPSIGIGNRKKKYKERPEHWRRSIYLQSPRFVQHPVLDVFNPANTFESQATRPASTTPADALFMLNAEFVRNQAAIFAERVLKEPTENQSELIRKIYWTALSRTPSQTEVQLGMNFLSDFKFSSPQESKNELVQYCHAILGLSEFIYIP